MTTKPNVMELFKAGKREEVIALLSEPIAIKGVVGPRSARAALEAATLLFDGDIEGTTRWMTERSVYLGKSPRECAEESDEGLELVIRMINRLYRGVYL